MSPTEVPMRPPADAADAADLFDYQKLREQLGYVLGAARRRKLLAIGVFLLVVGGTVGALAVIPRTFHCETKLLAQKNQIIAALGNPGHNISWEADMPLRAATETILRYDNLVSIIKQSDAVTRWPIHRAPILRLKDAVIAKLRGRKESPEDRADALVGLLGTRMEATVGEGGTIAISVDWPDDREVAYRLVEAASQNFLEARQVAEISTISEAISILEVHTLHLREQIDASVRQLEEIRETSGKPFSKVPRKRAAAPAAARPSAQSAEEAQLEVLLEGKRRAIKDLEEFHKQRLLDLQARLAEQAAIYSSAHPAVVEVQQRLDALSHQEPAQLGPLREEEAELEAQLRKQVGNKPGGKGAAMLGPLPAHIARLESEARESEDPAVEHARGELGFAMTKYANFLDRIDSARMELVTSRAAFKYRYTVIIPAEVPRGAIKPKVSQVMIAAIVAAAFLGLFAAAAVDLRSGRIVESWQVPRQLGLEILAEVRMP